MSKPLVSIVIATYNRREHLESAINSALKQTYDNVEIVVVCNSTDNTPALFTDGAKFDLENIQYHHIDERMGVAKARNFGYEKAKGDILITIDDDAIFKNEHVTSVVAKAFQNHRTLGILAFRVVNAHTGEIETLPHKDKDIDPNKPFTAPYFIGCGNAIRSSVFDDVGYYPESFRYGAEELDLSYRTIDAGYTIKYLPEATVIHKESPHGRFEDATVRRYLVENRIRFVVRNFPWRYAIPYMCIWSLYGLYLSRLNPQPVFKAYRTAFGERHSLLEKRSVISKETIEYLKHHSGRLLY